MIGHDEIRGGGSMSVWAPIYLDFFFQLSFEARPNNFSLTRLEAVRH